MIAMGDGATKSELHRAHRHARRARQRRAQKLANIPVKPTDEAPFSRKPQVKSLEDLPIEQGEVTSNMVVQTEVRGTDGAAAALGSCPRHLRKRRYADQQASFRRSWKERPFTQRLSCETSSGALAALLATLAACLSPRPRQTHFGPLQEWQQRVTVKPA